MKKEILAVLAVSVLSTTLAPLAMAFEKKAGVRSPASSGMPMQATITCTVKNKPPYNKVIVYVQDGYKSGKHVTSLAVFGQMSSRSSVDSSQLYTGLTSYTEGESLVVAAKEGPVLSMPGSAVPTDLIETTINLAQASSGMVLSLPATCQMVMP
jgi:hypothetical protein